MRLLVFTVKKFVTVHGHMNVKEHNVPNTITVRTHKGSFLNVPIAENPLVTNTGQNDNGRPECSRYLSRVTTTEMSPLFLSLNEWQ